MSILCKKDQFRHVSHALHDVPPDNAPTVFVNTNTGRSITRQYVIIRDSNSQHWTRFFMQSHNAQILRTFLTSNHF